MWVGPQAVKLMNPLSLKPTYLELFFLASYQRIAAVAMKYDATDTTTERAMETDTSFMVKLLRLFVYIHNSNIAFK